MVYKQLTNAMKSDMINTIRNNAFVGIDVSTCMAWNTQLTKMNGKTFCGDKHMYCYTLHVPVVFLILTIPNVFNIWL